MRSAVDFLTSAVVDRTAPICDEATWVGEVFDPSARYIKDLFRGFKYVIHTKLLLSFPPGLDGMDPDLKNLLSNRKGLFRICMAKPDSTGEFIRGVGDVHCFVGVNDPELATWIQLKWG